MRRLKMHVDILAYYAYSSKIQIFFSVGGYRFLVAWRPPLASALLGCGNVIAHSVIAPPRAPIVTSTALVTGQW